MEPLGKAPEASSPRHERPKLKIGMAVSGMSCCPACGVIMPVHENLCRYCGFDVKKGRTIRGRNSRPTLSWGWLWDMPRIILKAGITLFFLVLAAMGISYALRYSEIRNIPSLLTKPKTVEVETTRCSICAGRGMITCTTCGGDGQVNGEKVTKQCSNCQGSGLYRKRMSKESVVKCPFCRGTGVAEEYYVQQVCPTCKGRGVSACAACEGRGTISSIKDAKP